MFKGLLNQRMIRLFSWNKILNPQQLRNVIFDQILVQKNQPVVLAPSTNSNTRKSKSRNRDDEDDFGDDDFLEPRNLSEQANFFIEIKGYDLELKNTLDLLIELNSIPVPRTMSQNYRQYISFVQTIWEKMRIIKREYFDDIVHKKSFKNSAKVTESILERESKQLLAQVSYQLMKNIARVISKDKSRKTSVLEKARSLACFFLENYFDYLTIDERVALFRHLTYSLDDSVRYYFLFLARLKKNFNNLEKVHVVEILCYLTPLRFSFLYKKDIQYSIFSPVKLTALKEFEALVSALFTLYTEMIDKTTLEPESFAQILWNIYNCQ